MIDCCAQITDIDQKTTRHEVDSVDYKLTEIQIEANKKQSVHKKERKKESKLNYKMNFKIFAILVAFILAVCNASQSHLEAESTTTGENIKFDGFFKNISYIFYIKLY